MSDNIYSKSFDDFVKKLEKLEADVDKTLFKVTNEVTYIGMAQTKALTPKGKYKEDVFIMTRKGEQVHFKVKDPRVGGTLQSGWDHHSTQRKGKRYTAGYSNNVYYSLYVNYGHRIVRKGVTIGYAPGFFFLEAGVELMKDQYPRIFERELKIAKKNFEGGSGR